MITVEDFKNRAQGCELCPSDDALEVLAVAPKIGSSLNECALVCGKCAAQIHDLDNLDEKHWFCLNQSMWSSEPAVQVLAWRLLDNLSSHAWAQDLQDMLVLDNDTQNWAQALKNTTVHRDCHGQVLAAGDNVVLIKDLDVKGANFTAKRGTAVRGISLVADNSEQIEGRVNGQRIVILTQFVKKS